MNKKTNYNMKDPLTINGNIYCYNKKLGEGGQGITLKYYSKTHNIDVVIKEYKEVKDQKYKNIIFGRAQNEINALKKLNDISFTPDYIDSSITNKKPTLIMSFIGGKTIDKEFSYSTISIFDKLSLYRKLLTIIHNVHQVGIFHRDLKPDNIMVSGDDIFVVDFGLSISDNDDKHFLSIGDNRRVGAIDFLCPEAEVMSDLYSKTPGPRFDLYSLGKLLYYFLKKDDINHGLFPREKFAELPYTLNGNIAVFQNVIASVVTESYRSCKVNNINDYIKKFDDYMEIFMQLESPETQKTDKLDLKSLVSKDYKAQSELLNRSLKSTKISVSYNIKKILDEEVDNVINRVLNYAKPTNSIPTLSYNNRHTYLNFFDKKNKKVIIPDGYKLLKNRKLIQYRIASNTKYIEILLCEDTTKSVSHELFAACIYINIVGTKIEYPPTFYIKDLLIPITTTLNNDSIKYNIQSFLNDFETELKDELLLKVYLDWRDD